VQTNGRDGRDGGNGLAQVSRLHDVMPHSVARAVVSDARTLLRRGVVRLGRDRIPKTKHSWRSPACTLPLPRACTPLHHLGTLLSCCKGRLAAEVSGIGGTGRRPAGQARFCVRGCTERRIREGSRAACVWCLTVEERGEDPARHQRHSLRRPRATLPPQHAPRPGRIGTGAFCPQASERRRGLCLCEPSSCAP
jgi:hypothetical protein